MGGEFCRTSETFVFSLEPAANRLFLRKNFPRGITCLNFTAVYITNPRLIHSSKVPAEVRAEDEDRSNPTRYRLRAIRSFGNFAYFYLVFNINTILYIDKANQKV